VARLVIFAVCPERRRPSTTPAAGVKRVSVDAGPTRGISEQVTCEMQAVVPVGLRQNEDQTGVNLSVPTDVAVLTVVNLLWSRAVMSMCPLRLSIIQPLLMYALLCPMLLLSYQHLNTWIYLVLSYVYSALVVVVLCVDIVCGYVRNDAVVFLETFNSPNHSSNTSFLSVP